jgi:hypothetical protein
MSDEASKNDYRPKYYDILSSSDQKQYDELRSTFSSQMCRNRRGKRLEGFSDMLSSIRTFCIRHNDDDWKRCLVCGVCWLSNGIAINNRQLSLLIDKCKSSINGSLQKMGYSTLQSRSESSSSLCDTIPLLKNNFGELREWSVRLFVAATPQPNLPIYTVNTLHPFQSPMPSQYHTFSIQHQMYFPVVPMAMPVPQMPVQPVLPIPPSQSFFDDEFALAPTFLADDSAAPQIEQPATGPTGNQSGGELDLIEHPDPIPFQDDPFGLFGEKW